MKKLLLALLITMPLAGNASLFKLDKNSLVCNTPQPIELLIDQIVNNDVTEEELVQMMDFLVDRGLCVITNRNDIIVKVIDIKGDVYLVEAINQAGVTAWVHKVYVK
jgi:hypothetical protein